MTSGEFTFPTEVESFAIHYDVNNISIISTIRVRIYFRGADYIKVKVTADDGVTWNSFDYINSGTWVIVNLTTPGILVWYWLIGDTGTVIYAPKDRFGQITAPAIIMEMT